MEPLVFDLLSHMAQSGGSVVSKDALVEAIWNGLAVSDATIAARISAARAAVADAAGLESFDLFAASQAAPVAVLFAAQQPGRVRRMVLVGGYVEGRVFRPVAPGSVDEETMLAMIRAGWGKADSPFIRGFATIFAPDATPEQRDELVEMQLSTASAETAVTLRRVIDRFDVRADLPRVDVPALIFHAAGDAIHPISQGQKLAAHLKGAQFFRLEGGNHMLLPQDPAWHLVMDRTDAFLAN